MACICILAYLGLSVILYGLEYDPRCLYDCMITYHLPVLIILPACSRTWLPFLSVYCISINTGVIIGSTVLANVS